MAWDMMHRLRRVISAWTSREASQSRDKKHEAEETSTAWYTLTAEEVAERLSVSPALGLSEEEVLRIRREVGRNVLAGIAPRTSLQILAGQALTVPTALLAGAAGLSLLLGDLLEAGAIVLVVGCNVAVGYFSESRAEELLHAWGELRVEWAKVVRQGKESTIPAADVVPGDVLLLRAGDALPAHARIIWARELAVDESMLTGESEPAQKDVLPVHEGAPLAERNGMLYAGTVVISGEARALCVGTGQRTELGAIQRALLRAEDRASPLSEQLDGLGKSIAKIALGSSVVVMGLGLLRGQPISILLRSAVALGVAAIPEGLPAVGTTALALVSHKLRREGIVIRRLDAAETLGAVSVVCADKTGTLTENRMRLEECFCPSSAPVRVEWTDRTPRLLDWEGQPIDSAEIRDLLRIMALNADVEIDEKGTITSGSGTERALVEFAIGMGYPVASRRSAAKRVREQRRTAERSFMVTVHDHPEMGRIHLIKGAPEQVIALAGGLSEEERSKALAKNEEMASRGLRVLAFAWRKEGSPEESFRLAGLSGLRDPPRAGVREALGKLRSAGMTTMMLTGDQQRTAAAIGEALGIPQEHVLSRVTPAAKLAVVEALQREGKIVAMTGDGVNDGPALKAAHVGVAMGERGTDIARAVADVVLAHDDLPSLAIAVEEGRRLYDNVRRAIYYLSATNMSEVLAMLFGATVGVTPLGPLQLLWINILTDVAPALALTMEPAEEDVMRRPPRDASAPIFQLQDLRKLGRQAGVMAGMSLASYGLGSALGAGPLGSQTMAFVSLVTSQLLFTAECRATSAEKNQILEYALAGSFGLQAAALGIPALRSALGIQLIGPAALGSSVLLGALPTVVRRGRSIGKTFGDSVIVVERRHA